MPDVAFFTRSLTGAWRLARFDAGGMAAFDVSFEGFWRSFWAAGLVLPLYIFFLAINFEGTPVGMTTFVAVKGVGYALGWIAFPVAMIGLAILLRLTPNYVRFIVALNWAAVLQSVLFVPVNIIAALGGLDSDLGALLYLATLGAVLFYEWFVTRSALETSAPIAAGLVAVDVLLEVMIDVGFDRLV